MPGKKKKKRCKRVLLLVLGWVYWASFQIQNLFFFLI